MSLQPSAAFCRKFAPRKMFQCVMFYNKQVHTGDKSTADAACAIAISNSSFAAAVEFHICWSKVKLL
jgi:hypothetical protein